MNYNTNQPFSKRHGFYPQAPKVTVYQDAPEAFRFMVLSAAKEIFRLSPSTLREIVCRVLHKRPDPSNWSEYPNIWGEVEGLINNCEWFKVYDIVEAIARHPQCSRSGLGEDYERELNDCLREMGVGWQLKGALVQARGEDAHENIVLSTSHMLAEAAMPTAHGELDEAIRDLSRRPDPDLSGAIHHAMAALECVARQVTGQVKLTLGEIIACPKNPIPKPLDEAIKRVWGYASENARHGREDRVISRAEAQLIVGLAASVSMYLLQKRDAQI